ncbi:30S ribosome-binding factor RbfA [Coprothermobacteraceae bacterium]|nr:30S ribosome-binding factor RbfA [Coprothermobacteraceae bacterium]
MRPLRKERLQEAIKEELSKLLIQEMNDERLRMVTITDVDLSVDQKYLKVYFSAFPGQKSEDILKALEKLSGYLSGEVARRLRLRFAPEVRFVTDDSIERGVRMVRLLEELEDKGSGAGPSSGPEKKG